MDPLTSISFAYFISSLSSFAMASTDFIPLSSVIMKGRLDDSEGERSETASETNLERSPRKSYDPSEKESIEPSRDFVIREKDRALDF
jgi:hypothetical protein